METSLPKARAEPSTACPGPAETQMGDLGSLPSPREAHMGDLWCLPITNTPVALPNLTEAAR